MRKAFKYLVTSIYKPFLARYLSRPRIYRYKGIQVTVPPEVFHPGFFFSTTTLLKYISRLNLQKKTFLELGAGSGLIALLAAREGATVTATDINPIAVEQLSKNSRLNKLEILVILSDLFTQIPSQTFDIIAINPPYFKRKPKSVAEFAWYCGENGEYFENLFKTIGPYTHAHSQVLLILSSVCDIQMIERYAGQYGWKLNLLLRKKNWIEEMLLFQLV